MQQEATQGERQWTSRSIGSRFQHQIFYFLIRLGGRRAAYALLYIVVFWYVLFYPSIRKKSSHYLSHRFPDAKGFAMFKHTYRMCTMLAKALVDRAIVGILGPSQMRAELHGKQELLDLLSETRGLILINAHCGCWQAAMSPLSVLDTPVSMLMQREDGDVDRHYFEHTGAKCPYKIIDPRSYLGGALEMMGGLKNKEIVSVMGDRVLGNVKNIIRVPFLGAEANFPISAYKLAAATGTPCAVILSHKTGADSYEVELAGVIRVPEGTGMKTEDFRPSVEEFVGLLDEFCQKHPYQFFNFFDMWKHLGPNPT